MQVQLIVEDKKHTGRVIPIDVPSFLIGRAKGCDLRSGSSSVSRHHCIISTEHEIVSVQDLNTEGGTYVNGERILFPKILQNGDKIVVGKLSFVVSLQKPEEPVPNTAPEENADLLFEIRLEGQRVSVTKHRLLQLAKQGKVLPDDVITVDGTKVFADAIQDIIFGTKTPHVTSHTESGTYTVHAPLPIKAAVPEIAATDSAIYGYFKDEVDAPPFETESPAVNLSESTLEVSDVTTASHEETAADPFNINNEPSAQIVRPSKTEKSVFSEIGDKIAPSLEKVDSSKIKDWIEQNKKYLPYVFGVLCLFGLIGLCLSWGESSPPGIYYVRGTLALDGKSIEGVNVLLLPRDENGEAAGGLTDSKGRFTLTTGVAPVGSGAKAGLYDVTFLKTEREGAGLSAAEFTRRIGNRKPEVKYLIPKKYDNPKTSGLAPIDITAEGTNRFNFELTTPPAQKVTEVVQQPTVLPEKISEKPVTTETPKPPPIPKIPGRDFFEAASRGTIQDIENYIANGADVNACDPFGNTPLILAIQYNPHEDVAPYFIAKNEVDVNVKDRFGSTPLLLAMKSSRCSLDIVKALISRGSDVDAKDFNNRSALHIAASSPSLSPDSKQNNMVEVMRFLISKGAFVNPRDKMGRTPLDVANTEEKKALLRESGAVGRPSPSPDSLVADNSFVPSPVPPPITEIGEVPSLSATQPPDIQYNVGLSFFRGTEDIPQDKAEALKWFHAAAKQGHADAQYRVGMNYYFGWEISANEPEGLKWIQKAADQGHKEAVDFLQYIERQKTIFGTSP